MDLTGYQTWTYWGSRRVWLWLDQSFAEQNVLVKVMFSSNLELQVYHNRIIRTCIDLNQLIVLAQLYWSQSLKHQEKLKDREPYLYLDNKFWTSSPMDLRGLQRCYTWSYLLAMLWQTRYCSFWIPWFFVQPDNHSYIFDHYTSDWARMLS